MYTIKRSAGAKVVIGIPRFQPLQSATFPSPKLHNKTTQSKLAYLRMGKKEKTTADHVKGIAKDVALALIVVNKPMAALAIAK